MKHSAIANSINNGFDIVAIWEREGGKWRLLRLVRPIKAIALYWKNPEVRLVFPIGVDPNLVGKETLTRKRKYERKQQSPARSPKTNSSKALKSKSTVKSRAN